MLATASRSRFGLKSSFDKITRSILALFAASGKFTINLMVNGKIHYEYNDKIKIINVSNVHITYHEYAEINA